MTKDEIARIAIRYDTYIAYATLKALGIEPPKRKPKTAKPDRYRGARKLMNQRHGVRL